ncbi:IMC sub-compartment protein ISP1 [Cardiosporidium cionae]|uniref:IMC sub-compartment protein ISP1 n=1 Tax=Cardiosporidium cionae TaxID=476202 RepID=A0ABQ7J524_9APIC|nr:IMC sub-compartment protein ISP1 [Cardiosporidium cionae]|eukprot:KAF8819066.1 IMC sub-compartment protein ISP1 [Cardiosporidium cionae]
MKPVSSECSAVERVKIMGNTSTCCWMAQPIDKAVLREDPTYYYEDDYKIPSREEGSLKPYSKHEMAEFENSLISGVNIAVLLQDGSQLNCMLYFDGDGKTITINCNSKVRVIPQADVKAVLHGADQLKRVETKANLLNDNKCIALHLKKSGNCIPLRCNSLEEKEKLLQLLLPQVF